MLALLVVLSRDGRRRSGDYIQFAVRKHPEKTGDYSVGGITNEMPRTADRNGISHMRLTTGGQMPSVVRYGRVPVGRAKEITQKGRYNERQRSVALKSQDL